MFNSSNGGNGFSLSDIAAVLKGNGDGDGILGGNGITAIILLIIVMAFFRGWTGNGDFSGNGGGGNSASVTPYIYPIMSSMTSSSDTDYLSQAIRDLTGSVANDFQTLNTGILGGICDIQGAIASSNASTLAAMNSGFNAQTLASVNNTNAIQRDINAATIGNMQNTYALQATLAGMASDNRADTAQIAYNQATNACALQTTACNNTRDVIDAINQGNQMLANMIQQDRFDAVKAENDNLRNQLLAANFRASQGAQTSEILQGQNAVVNALEDKPPVAAYIVQNPNGCNCGYRYSGCMANV